MAKGKEDETVSVKMMKQLIREALDEKLGERLSKVEEKLDVLTSFKKDIDAQAKLTKENEQQIDDIDTYTRRNNIVFHGIPTGANENPLDLAIDIGCALGLNISQCDVDIAHRLKTRNDATPPPFIIRLVNRWRKEEIMERTEKLQPNASWWRFQYPGLCQRSTLPQKSSDLR